MNQILQLLAILLEVETTKEENRTKIPLPPLMTDAEIRKGKWVENQLEFGEMLFQGRIGEPRVFSGLAYSYNEKKEIFYTVVDPRLELPEIAP